MVKKTAASKKVIVKGKTAKVAVEAVTTPVRYSALPKLVAVAPAAKADVTADRIATKAFELFAAGRAGGEVDHWLAAEAELRAAA